MRAKKQKKTASNWKHCEYDFLFQIFLVFSNIIKDKYEKMVNIIFPKSFFENQEGWQKEGVYQNLPQYANEIQNTICMLKVLGDLKMA